MLPFVRQQIILTFWMISLLRTFLFSKMLHHLPHFSCEGVGQSKSEETFSAFPPQIYLRPQWFRALQYHLGVISDILGTFFLCTQNFQHIFENVIFANKVFVFFYLKNARNDSLSRLGRWALGEELVALAISVVCLGNAPSLRVKRVRTTLQQQTLGSMLGRGAKGLRALGALEGVLSPIAP